MLEGLREEPEERDGLLGPSPQELLCDGGHQVCNIGLLRASNREDSEAFSSPGLRCPFEERLETHLPVAAEPHEEPDATAGPQLQTGTWTGSVGLVMAFMEPMM